MGIILKKLLKKRKIQPSIHFRDLGRGGTQQWQLKKKTGIS